MQSANGRGGSRRRTTYTKEQVNVLVRVFKDYRYPGYELREALAKQIKVPEKCIHVWFQNRRARYPLKNKDVAIPNGTNQQDAPNVQPDGSLEDQLLASTSQDPASYDHGAGHQSTSFQVPQVLHGPVPQYSLGTEAPMGHNSSLSSGTGITLPSPYVGISPPPISPSTGVISSPYFPYVGNTLPPAAPDTNQALPQQATPPIYYGQQIQGSSPCTSLPLLTEEDLTILQLPAGSYQS